MVVVEVELGVAPAAQARKVGPAHAAHATAHSVHGRELGADPVVGEDSLLHRARPAEGRVPRGPPPSHAPVPTVRAGVPLGEDPAEEHAGGHVRKAGRLVVAGVGRVGGGVGGGGQIRGGGRGYVRDEPVLQGNSASVVTSI